MSAGHINPHLELQRLKKAWWWTDPANRIIDQHDQRAVEAAKAWELLRRTENYGVFFRVWKAKANELSGNSVAQLILQAHFRERLGDRAWLISSGGDPALTWIELTENARKAAQQIQLPRQAGPAESAPMSVSLCRIKRSGTTQRILPWAWEGGALKLIIPPGTRILPPGRKEGRYVVITFNGLLGEDTLHLQLDWCLQRQLGLPAATEMLKRLNFAGELLTDRTLLETAFDQYVRNERTAAEIRYPRLWKRRFLEAEDRNSQVRLTASRDQPDVICWIPACYDLKVVRELFHNQIRPENLKPRIEEFQKVWQRQKLRTSEWIGEFETRKDKVLPVFEKKIIQLYPEMTQLPRDLTVRRAGEIDWWDISAYDYRVRKLNSPVTDYLFECYRMESGKVILSHSEKDRLLKDWRNGRAAITRRLGEINDWFLPTVSQE